MVFKWNVTPWILAVAAASACVAELAPPDRDAPSWSAELRERVQAIPAIDSSLVDGDLPGEAPVLGVPRDLTQRSATQSAARAGASNGSAEQVAKRSRLEQVYGGDWRQAPERALDQFGYVYFRRGAKAADAGPVPDRYVVGPGDELLVTVSGSFQAQHKLTIDREGRVSVPELGPISVGGRKYSELEAILSSAYARVRRDFRLVVGLGRRRVVVVRVAGAVRAPGAIEVPATADLIAVLARAGGPDKSGSLRRIELRRAGRAVQTIDLYGLLLHGERAQLPLLHAGDMVVVPPIGTTVGVAGFVRRPAIYEVRDEATVGQVLALAGGLTPFAFAPRVQIERTSAGRQRRLVDVELSDDGRAASVEDGDLVLVAAMEAAKETLVRITGEVVRPGNYQYRGGMRLSELLRLADGLTLDARTRHALLSRQLGPAQQARLVHAGRDELLRRRVMVIDLTRVLAQDPSHDIALEPFDQLRIQSRTQTGVLPRVEVEGSVRRPGSYELTAGLRVTDLIAIAGDVKDDVFLDEAELIRWKHDPRRSTLEAIRMRFDLRAAVTRPGSASDPLLQHGDRLVIRSLRRRSLTVEVAGELRFSGRYTFPEGARISDLIAAAGGLLERADLGAASFVRRRVRDLQRARLEHLLESTRRTHEGAFESLVKDGKAREGIAGKIALEQSVDTVDRMIKSASLGRVVIPFLRKDFVGSDFDLLLESGDRLVVPRRRRTVSVLGHVFSPASFVVEPGMTVRKVLSRCGGPTELAAPDRVYVLHADGEVQALHQRQGRALRLDSELRAGDVVLVPRRALERSLLAQLQSVLAVGRHWAEVGALGRAAAQSGEIDITAVLQEMLREPTVSFDKRVLGNKR